MIIFGTRTMNSAQESGVFHCPRCSMSRPYVRQRVNRWFTLYFIPCIPMGSVGEFIECGGCGGTYGAEVLSYDPQAERAELLETFRRVIVLAMVSARRTEARNVLALRDACAEVLGDAPTEEEVVRDIGMARDAQAPLIPFLQAKANTFNDNGKKLVLEIAARVLAPDCTLTEADKQVLGTMGGALRLAPTLVESTIVGARPAIGGPK